MKNIIFFGAGASKADGVPIQNEIFDKYFEMCENERNKWTPEDGQSFEVGTIEGDFAWKAYCYYRNEKELVENFLEMYFGSISNKNYPTFEEVLALIDISTQRNEIFVDNGRYSLTEFRKILIETIKKTIEYYRSKSEHNYCNNLVRNLLSMNKLDKTVFVTTNYDMIIEKAIYGIGRKIDFGFEHMV